MDGPYIPANVFKLYKEGDDYLEDVAMVVDDDPTFTSKGIDINGDDSEDDLYGPYPTDDERRMATSQDRHDAQLYSTSIFDEMDLDHSGRQATTTMPHDSDSTQTAEKISSSSSNPRKELGATSPPLSLDLSHVIKGMYRILDLICEQGSGGLVDKIIISQDSLRAFIDDICPGAYASLTKVDFKALDRLTVKPIGIYGSREEIVRFLSSIGAVDDALTRVLSAVKDDSSGVTSPTLRSGLYVVRSFNGTADEQLYVLYWPQDTTWNDSALSSVRRNRVTFMRYLMKMCDQVIALISSEHADKIVWSGEEAGLMDADDDDESDRLFNFEVAKTNEQEETVTTRPGFQMTSRNITVHDNPPESPIDVELLKPRLLFGETTQGFMTSSYRPAKRSIEKIHKENITTVRLRNLLGSGGLRLNEDISDDALCVLVKCGLQSRFPEECKQWMQQKSETHKLFEDDIKSKARQMEKKLQGESSQLERGLHEAIIDAVIETFPTLNREYLSGPPSASDDNDNAQYSDKFASIAIHYPRIGELLPKAIQEANLSIIRSHRFRNLKDRLITIDILLQHCKDLDRQKRVELIGLILDNGDMRQAGNVLAMSTNPGSEKKSKPKGWLLAALASFWPEGDNSMGESLIKEARDVASRVTDPQFLSTLKDIVSREPLLQETVAETEQIARISFEKMISKLLNKVKHRALYIQQEDCNKQYYREASSCEEREQRGYRIDLVRHIEKRSQSTANSYTHLIDSVEEIKLGYSSGHVSYQFNGLRESFEDPLVEYTIHVLSLTAQDRHTLQLDPTFVPAPRDRFSHSFVLPVGYSIASVRRAQLLQNDKLLLIVIDRAGNLLIFLESFAAMDHAVKRERPRTLHRDKIGHDFLLAFDESKRMLAVCASTKLFLHIFVFDECYGSMQALGSAVNLIPWYSDETCICHVCFVCGSEELLLVDSSAQARIFSLVTLQFRPATLHLQQIPTAVYSSPDGSCLIVSHAQGNISSLTAYHWSTFGSTEGISLGIPDLPVEQLLVLTSLVNRNSVHLVQLDLSTHGCHSIALDITRKVTEFMFKEKGAKIASGANPNLTVHNCLIDCHAEVWTRFPVLPAVRRQTISSSSERHQKTIIFVSGRDHQLFSPHFCDMIQTFERTTRKPTGEELKSIAVSAMPFSAFAAEYFAADKWVVSQFRAGEWLVDFLCLIPIHIAITRENRFIPLKDGVSSAELEKSLLGAEVGRIVDCLSFGWYESLFQSYMACKPVKVVSSMGEQSVGKSFALNHLVDTSFAGSAMRTTEGVWMSVTPTEEALIVALDFEGVHSIERSAQEDTLLVLFNTAISNLVLFRNNFALSRDIAGLFQSFQSSSTVLDPAANPTLFQSTLMIIIKDVVDSDKAEIAREFSLKFGQIVQEEQDANFISRLHRGRLGIIPWPVIESKEFYRLFPTLKKCLDKQLVTHNAAGEFLHTLKILMAKLKANDWGALSQTMAAHRAQLLLSLLPNALAFGFSEVEPEQEPLKNFDSDTTLDMPDTTSHLFLVAGGAQVTKREAALAVLRHAWNQSHSRQLMADADWSSELSLHLDHLVNLRIDHVRKWITSNLSRFQTSHANIEELRRTFESATVDLRANVQLCMMQCASCHLLCVQSRLHEGPHHCQTSHECIHVCDFCKELPTEEPKICSIAAGHPGKHVCVVNAHLCGEPCKLAGKQGCLEECTKVDGHTDVDHFCSASVHTCGEPCALSRMKLADGTMYSCPGTCRIPCNEAHGLHLCDARLCPVSCQLCKRLCSNQDHLHGLQDGAIHLCGQEHSCTSLCSTAGICEIDTAPHSIEATFTGKHETFQYTKYSQIAKRLKCIKPIPPGATTHSGSHTHSMDQKAFHFCEIRCDSCGYFCTLPLGHSQQEHETRHGSMSQTRWAVDGPDDTSLELEGRKFSSNDDGAPMMCNLVCQAMGRHVHIDYCRAEDGTACEGTEVQHIPTKMVPNPNRAKDAVTHSLHWRRNGFKDPYSRDDQTNFAKCDAMCGGPEHSASATAAAQPSYCTLPMFHLPRDPNSAPANLGYISNDGHLFSCKNPVVMQQAFHVIFVIDRSGSMGSSDRRPLANSPASSRIVRHSNNRLGAVYSSLDSFWVARHAAVTGGQQAAARRDSYSVILFDHAIANGVINNFTSSPDQLLEAVLPYRAAGGTDFTAAIKHAQMVMEQNWSTERTPVVIFLSDGVCSVADQVVQDLCRSAVRLGKPLSFHAVSFGQDSTSSSLRRMVQISREIQDRAPRDPLAPAAAIVPSSYAEALDTVRLAETFLGIAESLRKPRGSLMR